MWGPWAIGMATANTINRFEHVGLRMFDPKAGLTVLEAALGVKRAELVVASFNWKQMSNTSILKRAIFADYVQPEPLNKPKYKVKVIVIRFALFSHNSKNTSHLFISKCFVRY